MTAADRCIQHADGQRYFAFTTLGLALEVRVIAGGLEIAIGIVVRQLQSKALFQGFHQMPGIRAIAAQISIDRGLEADGLVFRQADFFVQQLQQFTQGRGRGGRRRVSWSSVQSIGASVRLGVF